MRTLALHILAMQRVDVEWGPPAPGKGSRRESSDSEFSENSATSSGIGNDNAVGFPLFLSVPVVLFYLSMLSVVVSNCDWGGDQPGLNFGDAFYFSLTPIHSNPFIPIPCTQIPLTVNNWPR